jgi:hypothetical protein
VWSIGKTGTAAMTNPRIVVKMIRCMTKLQSITVGLGNDLRN